MLRPIAISLSLALLAANVASAQQAAPQPAPPLLAQAVAATQAQKRPYAFDYDQQSSATVAGSNAPVAPINWRAHFDSAGQAPHLHLVAPPHLEGANQQAFNAVAQKMTGLSWCASAEMGSAQNLHLVREDATSAVYSFQPSAAMAGHGVPAQRLHGEMTILKANPDISELHLSLTQPFSPIPFSSINTLDIAIHCEIAPNGRRYAASSVTDLAGSAVGHTFTEHAVIHTTNLTPAP